MKTVIVTADEPLDVAFGRGIMNRIVAKLSGEEMVISDGYHTMSELYDHRRALTAALLNTIEANLINLPKRSLLTFKSKLHNDGTMFDGYFICGFRDQYEKKTWITYHYELEYWDQFKIPEVEKAPEYDGHTSQDVIERLLKL